MRSENKANKKRPYRQPQLFTYGRLHELTQSGSQAKVNENNGKKQLCGTSYRTSNKSC